VNPLSPFSLRIPQNFKYCECFCFSPAIISLWQEAQTNRSNMSGQDYLHLLDLNIYTHLPFYELDIVLRNNPTLDVNINIDGVTAMMLAAAKGDQQSIYTLLHSVANRYLKDRIGNTAQDHGRVRGHHQLSFDIWEESDEEQPIYHRIVNFIDGALGPRRSQCSAENIFELFVEYLNEYPTFRYDSRSEHTAHDLLEKSHKGTFGVDCIGLSNILLHIFWAYGFTNLEEHTFVSIEINKHHPLVIAQKFRYFDGRQGDDDFACHRVLKRTDGLCFDPTFSCYYQINNIPFIPIE
jgi:hypothetical protein